MFLDVGNVVDWFCLLITYSDQMYMPTKPYTHRVFHAWNGVSASQHRLRLIAYEVRETDANVACSYATFIGVCAVQISLV